MEKKEILDQLEKLLEDASLDPDSRSAILESIQIIKKTRSREQWVKTIELLLRVLGVGSKFF